jgi:hypothetical protein
MMNMRHLARTWMICEEGENVLKYKKKSFLIEFQGVFSTGITNNTQLRTADNI